MSVNESSSHRVVGQLDETGSVSSSFDARTWFARDHSETQLETASVHSLVSQNQAAASAFVEAAKGLDLAGLLPDASEDDLILEPIAAPSAFEQIDQSLFGDAGDLDLFDRLAHRDTADLVSGGEEEPSLTQLEAAEGPYFGNGFGALKAAAAGPLESLSATESLAETRLDQSGLPGTAITSDALSGAQAAALISQLETGSQPANGAEVSASMVHPGYCACCGCGQGMGQPASLTTSEDSNNPESAEFVAQGNKWGSNSFGTTGGVITWSLMPGGISIDFSENATSISLDSVMFSGYETVIASAFDAWAAAADIKFLAVLDEGRAEEHAQAADIRLTAEDMGNTGVLGHAYYPKFGDVHFNSLINWSQSQFYRTSLHEIGHSIGLAHEETNTAIMAPIDNPRLNGLQQDDINGAREIYGADPNNGAELSVLDYDLPSDQINLEINRDVQAAYGTNNINLTGNALDNKLGGSNGKNTLLGAGGDDEIRGYGGADNLDGGSGRDLIFGGSGNDTLEGGNGADDLRGGSNNDILRGSNGVDRLTGDNGNDDLFGGSGNDNMSGGNGTDELFGGAGNDTMSGGNGADYLSGSSGNDRLSGGRGRDELVGGSGDDELNGDGGADVLGGGTGNDDLYGGGGADRLSGGKSRDYLSGGGQNDYMRGGSGKDILEGGNGADRLNGGTGNDTLTGGNGVDRFIFDPNSGSDTITDFVSLKDLIDVRDYNFASGNAVLSATSNSGGNAVIRLDANNDITLEGVRKADLDPNDFLV